MIINNELQKLRLNFSRCTNYDVAPLKYSAFIVATRFSLTILVVNRDPFFVSIFVYIVS